MYRRFFFFLKKKNSFWWIDSDYILQDGFEIPAEGEEEVAADELETF